MQLEQAFPRGTMGSDRGRWLPPRGILGGNFATLRDSGCIQAENDSLRDLFLGLMAMTGCNPCNGCPVWDRVGPGCKAFQEHHTAYLGWKQTHDEEIQLAITPRNATQDSKFAGMNMKQIAAALGISINEARRRKMAGTLFAEQ